MDKLLYKFLTLFFISCIFFINACTTDKNKEDSDTDPSENLNLEISASTNSQGLASASFNTSEDVSKFTISAESQGNDIRITRLTIEGTDYLTPAGANLSLAQEYSRSVATATAPSRQTDTPLNSPQEVSVTAQLDGSNNQSNQILFKITSKKDGNLSSGSLNMNLFYVGSVGAEETTKNAIKTALETSKRIFSNEAGINLNIKEKDIAGRVQLPDPSNGDNLFLNASQDADSPAVNVFIGGDISASSSSGEILGISASIPGPPTPTLKSAVVISIFASAGSDGVFDNEDIRILGETIAHESGHFMGLFHPVDFSGNVVAATDPLSDTPSCSFNTQCVANEDLISNLMFPNPVPDNRGNFIPQSNLSDEQRGVLNRYAAVN